MINVYCKEIDKMWFAAAIRNEAIIATTFAPNENDVLKHVLKSLPYNMPFQIAEKPTQFSKKVLSALKSIFDGKISSFKLKLEMKHLSVYAQKVLRCVFMVPVGYVTTYGEVAKAMGVSPRAVG
jgi:O6-methylguanine-DNA--protein-cysteine methyltransferase